MAFPYRKILCPVDFDDNSLNALDRAIEIARHFQSAVVLIHVIPMVLEFAEPSVAADYYQAQEKPIREKLDEVAQQKLADIDHQITVYTGDVAGCILRAERKFAPDLVVMATHGRGTIAHLLLGSVAEAVVRKSTCPVLTIRS
jgi:nucleotide-binding universal stress UspA family protein